MFASELASMDTPRIERYLAKAQECKHLATQVHDKMVKATYRGLAQQWRDFPSKSENSLGTPPQLPSLLPSA